MIRTIALVSAKGGGGKTTLSASIAVAALETGEKPCLVDLDPQGSLLAWRQRRKAEAPPPVERADPAQLAGMIARLAGTGFTLAIVDTAGTNSPGAVAAMKIADICMVPCRASMLDFITTRTTISALMQMGRPFGLVLNSCPAGKSSRLVDAGRALSLLGSLAPIVSQRMDFVDSLGLGLGPTELDAAGKAAQEIRDLWTWIDGRTKDGQAQSAA